MKIIKGIKFLWGCFCGLIAISVIVICVWLIIHLTNLPKPLSVEQRLTRLEQEVGSVKENIHITDNRQDRIKGLACGWCHDKVMPDWCDYHDNGGE